MNPAVAVFANSSYLSTSLVNFLKEKNCRVFVVDEEKGEWAINNLPGEVSYAFVIDLDGRLKKFNKIVEFIQSKKLKSVFVFSGIGTNKKRSITKSNYTVKTVYVGEIFGSDMDLTKKGPLVSFINNLVFEKKIIRSQNATDLYPVSMAVVCKFLIKELFTYWTGKEIFLATKISLQDLASSVDKIYPNYPHKVSNKISSPKVVGLAPLLPNDNVISEILEVVENLIIINLPKISLEIETDKAGGAVKKKRQTIKFNKSFLVGTVLVIFWLFLTPFAFLFASSASLFVSYKTALSEKEGLAIIALDSAETFSTLARSGFSIYSKTPLVGELFDLPIETANLLQQFSSLGKRALALSKKGKTLAGKVLGDRDYDISVFSNELYLELDALYNDTSFLEAELAKSNLAVYDIVPGLSRLSEGRDYLYFAKDFVRDLPSFLGANSPKTYLLLFQNNNELRPTGGFIGSFALVTFENGKLINTEVFDIYTADGQLKGYIAPPDPIRDYLGEASWFMRDSNWDPNFPNSAKRVEWFLDKSLDREVDGVIAIDLEVAKSILEVTGPIEVVDYADSLDHKNLYQKIQHEVEANFFPGSHKKANYLTAFSKSLLERVKSMSDAEYLEIIRPLLKNLEARDIQIFLHDSRLSETVLGLGWDGSIGLSDCSNTNNCMHAWQGIVEANLGVNKANYYIKRSSELFVEVNGQKIKSSLTFNIANLASRSKNIPESRYKVYLRLLVPKGAKVGNASVNKGENQTWLEPDIEEVEDRVEAGVLVEILPGEEKTVTFSWERAASLDFSKPGNVAFSWRKQAGVPPFPVKIFLQFPRNIKVVSQPSFSLTSGNLVGYNTDLSGDFKSEIRW